MPWASTHYLECFKGMKLNVLQPLFTQMISVTNEARGDDGLNRACCAVESSEVWIHRDVI